MNRHTQQSSKTSRNIVSLAYIFIGIGVVVLLFSVYLFLFSTGSISSTSLPIDSDKFDHFGSFASGTIGVLWSLSGVLLLFESLSEQKRATEENNRQVQLQLFENTFFQLANLHNEITTSMEVRIVDIEFGTNILDEQGRQISLNGVYFFETLVKLIKESYDSRFDHVDNLDDYRRSINIITDEVYFLYSGWLSRYFGNLKSLLQVLEDFKRLQSEIVSSDRWQKIVNLKIENFRTTISNQLSTHEVILISYFVLSSDDRDFANLLVQYRITERLPDIVAIEASHDVKWEGVICKPEYLLKLVVENA